MMGKTCNDCKFYKRDTTDSMVCTRFPPQVFYTDNGLRADYPPVYSFMSACGEFRYRASAID